MHTICLGPFFVWYIHLFHVFNAFYLWISNEIIQENYNLVEKGIFQQKQKKKNTKMTADAALTYCSFYKYKCLKNEIFVSCLL